MPIVCSLARRRWTTRCMCCLRLRSPSNVWLSCTLASITSYCRISFAVTAQVVWLGLTQGVGILPSCCEQGMHRGYPSGLGGLLLGMWVRVESEGCLPAPCVGGLGDTLHPVLARINKQRHEVASSSRTSNRELTSLADGCPVRRRVNLKPRRSPFSRGFFIAWRGDPGSYDRERSPVRCRFGLCRKQIARSSVWPRRNGIDSFNSPACGKLGQTV
jgi:hypothetical protein